MCDIPHALVTYLRTNQIPSSSGPRDCLIKHLIAYTYGNFSRDYDSRQRRVGLGDAEITHPHGIRVWAYNRVHELLGRGIAAAHGGWAQPITALLHAQACRQQGCQPWGPTLVDRACSTEAPHRPWLREPRNIQCTQSFHCTHEHRPPDEVPVTLLVVFHHCTRFGKYNRGS